MRLWLMAGVLAVVWTVAGCASVAANSDNGDEGPVGVEGTHHEVVEKRAQFDLNCDADELQVETIMYDRARTRYLYGVTGCNRRATYVLPSWDGTPYLNHMEIEDEDGDVDVEASPDGERI